MRRLSLSKPPKNEKTFCEFAEGLFVFTELSHGLETANAVSSFVRELAVFY